MLLVHVATLDEKEGISSCAVVVGCRLSHVKNLKNKKYNQSVHRNMKKLTYQI